MLARLRAFLLKLPVLITLGLVALYFLFGYFAFGPLAKWGAEKYILDKTGHPLTLDEPEFDPLRLSLNIRNLKLTEPGGQHLLAFEALFLDFEAASLFKRAYAFADIRLAQPHARVELRPDGSLNWSGFLEAFKDQEDEEDKPLPRLLIQNLVLERGRVDFVDHKVTGGFESGIAPIDFQLVELSTLPDDKGLYTLSTKTEIGARIRWKGELGLNPILATGDLAISDLHLDKVWPYIQGPLRMAPPQGQAAMELAYRFGYADKQVSLDLNRVGVELNDLRLQGLAGTRPAIRLNQAKLSDARFSLEQRRLDLPAIQINGGEINLLRRQDGTLDVQDWLPKAPVTPSGADRSGPRATEAADTGNAAHAGVAGPGAPEAPWHIVLAGFNLDGLAVNLTDQTFIAPLSLALGNVRLGFKAEARVGAGEPDGTVSDLGINLENLVLASPGIQEPLFRLAALDVSGGEASLAQQQARVAKVRLSQGRAWFQRQPGDRIPQLDSMARHPGNPQSAARPAPPGGQGSGWKYAVDQVDLTGFSVALRDETVAPVVALDLEGIRASVQGISEKLHQPLPVSLALVVKQGGGLEMRGRVVPAKGSADLKIALAGLALAPVQPYLAQQANLVLASGVLSSSGRLNVDAAPRYSGNFALENLLINESLTGERFLAWRRLATEALKVDSERMDIGLLSLEGLGSKLIINPDKSINVTAIFKPAASPRPEADAAQAEVQAAAAAGKPFTLAVERMKLSDGELDFADLSLAFPFGTRIHGLAGHVNDITSVAGAGPAQLELEGRVDDYGLARAAGQLNLFDPTGYMDIKTVFCNVEMTRLTPYSATFAGRRIASGKLSLDLEYKIQQRQLQGDNQIVMEKLTLGERVESAGAKNLPLDLAIAILQDSEGKIDLGLPVSGSLDDPQFSYGSIVWKAIVNVITKIVLAPFKALGSLLGGNAEKMEAIAFEVGSARLLPPEKEKLMHLAQALAKRPGLAVTVKGVYQPEADRAFMQEEQLRRAVAARMGIKVAQDSDLPPISTANAKTRAALEGVYAERMGKEALARLQSFHQRANPEQKEGMGKLFSRFKGVFKGKEEPLPPEELEALRGADLHEVMYRRLLAREEVPLATLEKLAERRAMAIMDELIQVGGVAGTRVSREATLVQEAGDTHVNAKLGLAVLKQAPVPDQAVPAGPTR